MPRWSWEGELFDLLFWALFHPPFTHKMKSELPSSREARKPMPAAFTTSLTRRRCVAKMIQSSVLQLQVSQTCSPPGQGNREQSRETKTVAGCHLSVIGCHTSRRRVLSNVNQSEGGCQSVDVWYIWSIFSICYHKWTETNSELRAKIVSPEGLFSSYCGAFNRITLTSSADGVGLVVVES